MARVQSAVLPMLIAYPHFWHQFLTAWAARLGSTVVIRTKSQLIGGFPTRWRRAHLLPGVSTGWWPTGHCSQCGVQPPWVGERSRPSLRKVADQIFLGGMWNYVPLQKLAHLFKAIYFVPRKLSKNVWIKSHQSVLALWLFLLRH